MFQLINSMIVGVGDLCLLYNCMVRLALIMNIHGVWKRSGTVKTAQNTAMNYIV
jgi:hypothetical protein